MSGEPLIAAPSEAHAALALTAMEAGLDVFVEKPLALTTADAERCTTRAAALGRVAGMSEEEVDESLWPGVRLGLLVREAGGMRNDFFRGNGLLEGNAYLVACPGVYGKASTGR